MRLHLPLSTPGQVKALIKVKGVLHQKSSALSSFSQSAVGLMKVSPSPWRILFLPVAFRFYSKSFIHLSTQSVQWGEILRQGRAATEANKWSSFWTGERWFMDLVVRCTHTDVDAVRKGLHITVMVKWPLCRAMAGRCLRATLLYCVFVKKLKRKDTTNGKNKYLLYAIDCIRQR